MKLWNKVKGKLAAEKSTTKKEAELVNLSDDSSRTVKYTVRAEKWLKKNAEPVKKEEYRITGKMSVAGTNIDTEESLPYVTRVRDAYMEKILRSGQYTMDNFLVMKNPYSLSPLTAMVLFYTKEKYKVKVTVKGKEDKETKQKIGSTDVTGATGYAHYHRVPVVGLYAGRKSRVILKLIDEQGKACYELKFSIKCDELPKSMQDMVHVSKYSEVSAFPLTFVYGGSTRFPYAFDRAGNIRLYIARQPKPYGLYFLSEGHFLFAEKNILMPSFSNPHSNQVFEMDMMGRVLRIYNARNGLHHDAWEMSPGGNIMALGSTLIKANEDLVMEIDRSTGKILKTIDMESAFDDTYQDGIDWIHLNTVSYDESDNSVLVCGRNLHSVAKLDWETGQIKWLLCNPKFWADSKVTKEKLLRPVGDDLQDEGWFYQAHAAYMIPEDLDGNPDTKHLIIYDNHWHKRRSVDFFDEDPNSFVRIYEINEKEGTVSLFKNYAAEKSKIRSNAILCKEKNRLYCMSGFLAEEIDGKLGMVKEFNYETGELVNEYMTRESYYRAYEMPLCVKDLSKKLDYKESYILGELRSPFKTEKPEINDSLAMPQPKKNSDQEKSFKGTKEERKQQYLEALKNSEVPFDVEVDLSNVEMSLSENILYVKCVDHLLQKIYFVGSKDTFVQDYSDTHQTSAEIFGRMYYALSIPLADLPADHYDIYFDCDGKLYNSEKWVEL